MLHLPTAATVAASVLTGALLVTAGTTLANTPAEPVPTVGIDADAESIGDPWAWAACVTTVYNMGGGTDSDMATCDRLYPVPTSIVADCRWNAGESDDIAWGDETARCTWKERDDA
jgi:hypothetical protein